MRLVTYIVNTDLDAKVLRKRSRVHGHSKVHTSSSLSLCALRLLEAAPPINPGTIANDRRGNLRMTESCNVPSCSSMTCTFAVLRTETTDHEVLE